eukprot:200461-Prorocentrum_minimum.AAC.1
MTKSGDTFRGAGGGTSPRYFSGLPAVVVANRTGVDMDAMRIYPRGERTRPPGGTTIFSTAAPWWRALSTSASWHDIAPARRASEGSSGAPSRWRATSGHSWDIRRRGVWSGVMSSEDRWEGVHIEEVRRRVEHVEGACFCGRYHGPDRTVHQTVSQSIRQLASPSDS